MSVFEASDQPAILLSELQTELESILARAHGRAHCILTGSGTTALYVVFEALGLPMGSRVLYPDLTCETALNASIYAGLTPVFGDVSVQTCNLDIDAARDVCARERVCVVVATHLYGNILDIPALRAALGARVIILEDAAQAYGGRFLGRPVGGLGDASVISFGAGKTMDCGGGGAILLDSEELWKRCREVRSRLAEGSAAGKEHRDSFMRDFFLESRRQPLDVAGLYERKNELKRKYRDGFLYQADPTTVARIQHRFADAESFFARRRANSSYVLAQIAQCSRVEPLYSHGEPALWRASFLSGQRDVVYDCLVRAGILASRFFAPLHRSFGIPDTTFPVASRCADQVVNVGIELNPAQQLALGPALRGQP